MIEEHIARSAEGTDYGKGKLTLLHDDGAVSADPCHWIIANYQSKSVWVSITGSATAHDPSLSLDSLGLKYSALFEALGTMQKLDDDDALYIDAETHRAACSVLSLLSYKRVDPPRVFAHGGDAVVFSWAQGDISHQLTVSVGSASLGKRIKGQGAVLLAHIDLAQGNANELISFLKVDSDRAGTNPIR